MSCSMQTLRIAKIIFYKILLPKHIFSSTEELKIHTKQFEKSNSLQFWISMQNAMDYALLHFQVFNSITQNIFTLIE